MNWKRLLWAALAAFILLQLTDFLIHGIMLEGHYQNLSTQGIFRSEAEMWGYMWVKILMNALFSLLFTYIFIKGYEGKGILEGIRYGIIIGFFWKYRLQRLRDSTYILRSGLVLDYIRFRSVDIGRDSGLSYL
jgi:hypothetical protein